LRSFIIHTGELNIFAQNNYVPRGFKRNLSALKYIIVRLLKNNTLLIKAAMASERMTAVFSNEAKAC